MENKTVVKQTDCFIGIARFADGFLHAVRGYTEEEMREKMMPLTKEHGHIVVIA